MNNIVLIALGLLVSGISFWGMCSFIKNRLGIEGTIAPLVSSCTIIIVLMCGGMLGILGEICPSGSRPGFIRVL